MTASVFRGCAKSRILCKRERLKPHASMGNVYKR